MNAIDRLRRGPAIALCCAGLLNRSGEARSGPAPPAEEERLQILTDPEAIKKKLEKDKASLRSSSSGRRSPRSTCFPT